jgi:hypothetical protein
VLKRYAITQKFDIVLSLYICNGHVDSAFYASKFMLDNSTLP